MYIEQAFRAKHEIWRYLVGAFAVFIVSQLGALPLIFIATFKIMSEGGDILELQDQNVIMTILDSNLTLFLMLLGFVAGMIGLYFIVRYLHKQNFKELTTSRKKVDWSRIFFGFGLVAVVTVVFTIIAYYQNPGDFIVQFDPIPFLILFVIAIIMIPIQTSFEEYLFRGYLMQGIGVNAKNRWLPLILTSVIFGGLHIANPEVSKIGYIIMVYYIGTGLFLGIMTLMDEGMELALGYHAGNNLVAALLVTADWTVFQTHSILKDMSEPTAGLDILIPVFVMFPTLLFIMSKKYKWTDWKGKLFGRVEEPVLEIDENDTFFEEI